MIKPITKKPNFPSGSSIAGFLDSENNYIFRLLVLGGKTSHGKLRYNRKYCDCEVFR